MRTLGDLFNLALNTCGNVADVADPEAQIRSATMCRLHLPSARHAIFSAFNWPELTGYSSLGLLHTRDHTLPWTDGDPAPGFRYTFGLPEGCVLPRYLHDYSRFELGVSATGQILYANNSPVILCYTRDVSNPAYWSPQLYDAVTFELGARLNMAKNGKASLTNSLRQQAYEILAVASVAAANSEDTYIEAVPQGWAAAGFAIPPMARFFYPTSTYRVEGINA